MACGERGIRTLGAREEHNGFRDRHGELDPSEILEYEVEEEEGRLSSLIIHNYGGERRLREINSSLRWTFDKMYDKITQG